MKPKMEDDLIKIIECEAKARVIFNQNAMGLLTSGRSHGD